MSARSLSVAAGLGVNYVNSVELGKTRPKSSTIDAISEALALAEHDRGMLRAAAGIDPNPAASPEAKHARRSEWRLLLYVLVNHVLLPRLELSAALERARHPELRAALNAAIRARHVFEMPHDATPHSSVYSFIERGWSEVDAKELRAVAESLAAKREILALFERTLSIATPPDHLGTQTELQCVLKAMWAIDETALARLLTPLCREPTSLGASLNSVDARQYDRNFGVAFFPLLCWNVYLSWPFEKAVLPFARMTVAQQRTLYDAVCGGLSLHDFDDALLGRGALGASLVAGGSTRRAFGDFVESDDSTRLVRFCVEQTVAGVPPYYVGPEPSADALFDHLDRSELLSRFPFIRIDGRWFARFIESVELPSWTTWLSELAERTAGIDRDKPPFSQKCARVVHPVGPIQTGAADRSAGSATLHALADHLRGSAWVRMHQGRWSDVLAAAELLGLRANWLDFIRAVAARPADAPPKASL